MEIFCSTGGFKTLTFYETACNFLNVGIKNVELSAGKIETDYLNKLDTLSRTANLKLHNYFPPANEPFVLNLASPDAGIARKSMSFYRELIELSARVYSPSVGIHAGFLFDPPTHELGKAISTKKINSRDEALSVFTCRVKELSSFASSLNVRLLVENNVLSKANFESHHSNILLLADHVEIAEFMISMNGEVGLLLDVGHLKVSAKTLNFDPLKALQQLNEFAEGYHLSDNLGESDDHLAFDLDVWFLPFLDRGVKFATLEIDNLHPEGLADLSRKLDSYLLGTR